MNIKRQVVKFFPGRFGLCVSVLAAGAVLLPAGTAWGQTQGASNEPGPGDNGTLWIGNEGYEWGEPGSWLDPDGFDSLPDDTGSLDARPVFTSFEPIDGEDPPDWLSSGYLNDDDEVADQYDYITDAGSPSDVDQPDPGKGRWHINGMFFENSWNGDSESSSFTIEGNPIQLGSGGIHDDSESIHTINTDIFLDSNATIDGDTLMHVGDDADNPITINTTTDSANDLTFDGRTYIRANITGNGDVIYTDEQFLFNSSDYTGDSILRGGQVVIGEDDSLGAGDTIRVERGPGDNVLTPMDEDLVVESNIIMQDDLSFGDVHDLSSTPNAITVDGEITYEFNGFTANHTITSEQRADVTIAGPVDFADTTTFPTFETIGESVLRVEGSLLGPITILDKKREGTLVLAGNNQSLDGNVTTFDGHLRFAHQSALAGSDTWAILGETDTSAEVPFSTDTDVQMRHHLEVQGDQPMTFEGDWTTNSAGPSTLELRVNSSAPFRFSESASVVMNDPVAVQGTGTLTADGTINANDHTFTMNMTDGQGELILSNENMNFDTFELSGGTLRVGDPNATQGAGTLEVQSTSGLAAYDTGQTISEDIDLNGSLRFADGEDLTVEGDVTAFQAAEINVRNSGTTGSEDAPTELAGEFNLQSFVVTLVGNQPLSISGKIVGDSNSSLVKNGTNTVTLSEDSSGFNGTLEVLQGLARIEEEAGIAGDGVVNGGEVWLEGDVDGTMMVRNDGLLFGDGGTIGQSLTVQDGGVVSPGNSIGTITVSGSGTAYELEEGSVQVVEFNATSGENDTVELTDSNGQARVRSGAGFNVVQLDDGGISQGHELPVIDTQDQVIVDDPSSLDIDFVNGPLFMEFVPDPDFTSGDEDFSLVANRIPFSNEAEGDNNRDVSEGLEALGDQGRGDELLAAINRLPDFDAFNDEVGQLGPAQHTGLPLRAIEGVQTFHRGLAQHNQRVRRRRDVGEAEQNPFATDQNLSMSSVGPRFASADDTQVLAQMNDDMRQYQSRNQNGFGAADQQETVGNDWSVFAQAIGGRDNYDAEDGRPAFDADIYGVQLGADRGLNDERFTLGIAGGYTSTDLDFTRGEGTIDSFRFGPYLNYQDPQYVADVAFSYGYHDNEVERDINLPGFTQTATGSYNAHDLSAHASGALNQDLSPIVALDYMHYRRDGFTESGAGAANLEVESDNSNSLEGTLGVQWTDTWNMGEIRLEPNAFVGWAYEFLNDDNDTTASFAGTGDSFRWRSPGRDGSSIRFGAGLGGQLTENFSTNLQYHGRSRSDGDSHTLQLGFTYRF